MWELYKKLAKKPRHESRLLIAIIVIILCAVITVIKFLLGID